MLTDTSANCTHLNLLICHLVLILLLRVDVDVDGGDGGGGQGILLQGWRVCREKMILTIKFYHTHR